MKLLVIRHGPAGDPEAWEAEGRDDRLRPLTPEGKEDMRQAAAGLATLIKRVDALLTSPLLRATQTAEIVAHEYGCRIEKTSSLEPNEKPEAALQTLHDHRSAAMVGLVGHEPHLSSFICYTLTGKSDSFVELKKGGACLLQLETLAAGKATLLWLLTRRELARLAE